MDLTTEQKLAINMSVARDMWPDCDIDDMSDCDNEDADIIIHGKLHCAALFNIFDPEKGDLNKAVEFYKLDVYLRETNDGTLPNWVCESFYGTIRVHSKSRDSAMRQAVTAASGANQTKEDE